MIGDARSLEDHPVLIDQPAAARVRPPHYLHLTTGPLVDLDTGSDDEPEPDPDPDVLEVHVIDAFDVLASENVDDWDGDAVWDNWTGQWAVAPDWVWEFDVASHMVAEGHARYDQRPA